MSYVAIHRRFPVETESVLQAMWDGSPLILVNGPIGSGKSEVALRAAALASLDGKVVFVVPDMYRLKDIIERFSLLFPRLVDSISFVTPEDLFDNKWDDEIYFSWMIIDDADHISDAIFALIAPLALRFVLFFSSATLRRPLLHSSDYYSSSVLQPSTTALLSRSWLELRNISLVRSHRIPQDSSDVFSSLLGGDSFNSSSAHPARAIDLPQSFELHLDIDRAISVVSSGFSLVGCYLPEQVNYQRLDMSALCVASDLVNRLLIPGFRLVIAGTERTVVLSDIVVIVPDFLYRDMFTMRYPNIVVKTMHEAISGFPITVVVDVNIYSDVESRAQFLANALSLHYIASFVIRRPCKNLPPISTGVFRDRSWDSFEFLEGIERALSSTHRRIRIQERI